MVLDNQLWPHALWNTLSHYYTLKTYYATLRLQLRVKDLRHWDLRHFTPILPGSYDELISSTIGHFDFIWIFPFPTANLLHILLTSEDFPKTSRFYIWSRRLPPRDEEDQDYYMKNSPEEDYQYYNEDYPEEDQEISPNITSPLFVRSLSEVFARLIL